MAPDHDILDDFDDRLARSIETSKQSGQWQDGGLTFDDPKVADLARKLNEVPAESYNERRLQELQRRVAAKEAATRPREPVFGEAPPTPTPTPAAKPGDPPTKPAADWRENVIEAQGPLPILPPTPSEQVTATVQPALGYLKTITLAAPVFATAAILQGIVVGFTPGLVLRCAAATVLAGCMWRVTGAGRFQAAGLAMAAHLMVFFTDVADGDRTGLMAVFLGLLVVMIGGGAMGVVREHRSDNGRA